MLVKKVTIILSLILIEVLAVKSFAQSRFLYSPTVRDNRTVTFKYESESAKSVVMSAEFLDERIALEKVDSSLWEVTVGPIDPDIYPYYYIVDGVEIADPRNPFYFPNERFKRSLVEIPGDNPLLSAYPDVPHGKLTYELYQTDNLGTRPLWIYTPPGYEADPNKKYPVLYLLHGTTDTEETWTKVGRAHLILDKLIAEGKAEPMLVVMPYGRAYPVISRTSGSLRNWDNLQVFTPDFLENIVPFVEANYRVREDRQSRAITGFSGGGGTSLYIGLNNPELFAWVGGFAPGMREEEFDRNNAVPFKDPKKTNDRLELFWIGCGSEDFLYPVVSSYLEVLNEKGIEHEQFITSGGHTWMNCRLFLTEFSQKLFK